MKGLSLSNLITLHVVYNQSSSFIPRVQQMQTEEQAIRPTIAGNDPLEWPPIENTPINEFYTEGLATMVLPTLFPYGKGVDIMQ